MNHRDIILKISRESGREMIRELLGKMMMIDGEGITRWGMGGRVNMTIGNIGGVGVGNDVRDVIIPWGNGN